MIELTEVYQYGGRKEGLGERPLLVNTEHIVTIRPTRAFPDYSAPIYRLQMTTGDIHFITTDVGFDGLVRTLSTEAA